MRKISLLAGLAVFFWFSTAQSQTNSARWIRHSYSPYGGPVNGIAADAEGNVVLTGKFSTYEVFGTITLRESLGRSAYLASFRGNGDTRFARVLSPGEGWRIGLDTNGNSYVIGHFDPASLFLRKLDPAGNTVWDAPQSGGMFLWALAVSPGGDSYVLGTFGGTVTFGNISVTATNQDLFLAKYDSNGNALWVKTAPGADYPRAVCLDPSGNVIVGGYFLSETARFDGFELHVPRNDWLHTQLFVVKIQPDGQVLWAKQGGGGTDGRVFSLVADQRNEIYAAIYAAPGLQYGSYYSPKSGVFLMKLSATGDALWTMPDLADARTFGMAIDRQNNLTFGYPGFLARFTPGGTRLWTAIAPGGEDFAGVALDGQENLFAGLNSSAVYLVAKYDRYPPILQWTGNRSSMIFSWPTNMLGFRLEQASNTLDAPWIPVANIWTNGDSVVSTNETSTGNSFFRLRHP